MGAEQREISPSHSVKSDFREVQGLRTSELWSTAYHIIDCVLPSIIKYLYLRSIASKKAQWKGGEVGVQGGSGP